MALGRPGLVPGVLRRIAPSRGEVGHERRPPVSERGLLVGHPGDRATEVEHFQLGHRRGHRRSGRQQCVDRAVRQLVEEAALEVGPVGQDRLGNEYPAGPGRACDSATRTRRRARARRAQYARRPRRRREEVSLGRGIKRTEQRAAVDAARRAAGSTSTADIRTGRRRHRRHRWSGRPRCGRRRGRREGGHGTRVGNRRSHVSRQIHRAIRPDADPQSGSRRVAGARTPGPGAEPAGHGTPPTWRVDPCTSSASRCSLRGRFSSGPSTWSAAEELGTAAFTAARRHPSDRPRLPRAQIQRRSTRGRSRTAGFPPHRRRGTSRHGARPDRRGAVPTKKETAMSKTDDRAVALVTGGTSGIGLATVRALVGAGHPVAFCGRDKDRVIATAAMLGEEGYDCRGHVCDIRDRDGVEAFVDAVVEDMGEPRILVNNAGRGGGGHTAELDDQTWLDVLDTNLNGTFWMTRAVLRRTQMGPDGRIVMIASTGGKQGVPLGAPYSASKAGFQAKIPMGRYSTPEEVAAMVRHLCSAEAASVTAQAVNVCGGLAATDRLDRRPPSGEGEALDRAFRRRRPALLPPGRLAFYDHVVLGLSNRLLWRCPTSVMLDRYHRLLSSRIWRLARAVATTSPTPAPGPGPGGSPGRSQPVPARVHGGTSRPPAAADALRGRPGRLARPGRDLRLGRAELRAPLPAQRC
ncbi:hypothetical protein L7F22_036278 [Adiantum nelumboides]|nr:hypothetical protein [Adiantum nelumboides]